MFSRTKIGGATKAPKQVAVVSAQTRTQTTAQTLAAAQAVVKLQAVARGHSSRKLVNGVREAVAAETLVAMNLVRCLRASRRAHVRMTTFPCAHAQRAPCPPLAAQLGSELEYLNALTEVCERFEGPLARASVPEKTLSAVFAAMPNLIRLHRSLVTALEAFASGVGTQGARTGKARPKASGRTSGKVSTVVAQRNETRLAELQAELKEAVEAEDYAKAAELKPQIKELKATIDAATEAVVGATDDGAAVATDDGAPKRRRLASLLLEFVPQLSEMYMRYARQWAAEAEYTLRLLENDPSCMAIVGSRALDVAHDEGGPPATPRESGEAGGGGGPLPPRTSKLRALLELAIERVAVYEISVVEIQLATQPADPGWATIASLLEALVELAQQMSTQRQELARRTALRNVHARFKPGEVDELLEEAPRRALVHSGVLLKANRVGKLVRHYFLFVDGTILTAESAPKSAMSSKSSKASAPLKKCKWLSLEGASLRIAPLADPSPCYFEICYAGDGTLSGAGDATPRKTAAAEKEKTSALWAESAGARDEWVQQLLKVLHAMAPAPPPPMPPKPRYSATDAQVRRQLRARVACYAREAVLVRGGWHAAVLENDEGATLSKWIEHCPEQVGTREAVLGATPLHLAVEAGAFEAVQMLLAAMPSSLVDEADSSGLTPLYVAVLCLVTPAAEAATGGGSGASGAPVSTVVSADSRLSIVQLLLKARANVHGNALRAGVDTPLLMALGAGHARAVNMLLTSGAYPRDVCLGGRRMSALELAISTHQPPMVYALLRAGVSVASSPDQPSLLHLACSHQPPSAAIVSALLEHGAQPNLPDVRGIRPIQLLAPAAAAAAAVLTAPPPPPPPPPPGDGDEASAAHDGGEANSPSAPLMPWLASSPSAPAGVEFTALCETMTALVSGGARLEVHGKPMLAPETHPTLAHFAKQAAAKYKADKAVPRLQQVADHAFSEKVHAQLGCAWVEDSKLAACMGCNTPFTSTLMTSGRHHCRMLGITVCEACSTKRVIVPGQGTSGVRVCDAAYNVARHLGRLADAHDTAAPAAAAARPPPPPRPAAGGSAPTKPTVDREAAARRDLLGSSSRAAATSGGAAGCGDSAYKQARTAQDARYKNSIGAASAAHEAHAALRERGEKLASLNDKAGNLANDAEQFHDLARQLRLQAERNSKWLPF